MRHRKGVERSCGHLTAPTSARHVQGEPFRGRPSLSQQGDPVGPLRAMPASGRDISSSCVRRASRRIAATLLISCQRRPLLRLLSEAPASVCARRSRGRVPFGGALGRSRRVPRQPSPPRVARCGRSGPGELPSRRAAQVLPKCSPTGWERMLAARMPWTAKASTSAEKIKLTNLPPECTSVAIRASCSASLTRSRMASTPFGASVVVASTRSSCSKSIA